MKPDLAVKSALFALVLIVAVLGCSVAGQAAAPAAGQDRRVALVIGNGAYREAPLRNAVNDARAMAGALGRFGFEIIALENATQAQMNQAIAKLAGRLSDEGAAVVYYAGHGIQVKGRNMLVPIDADMSSETSVRTSTVDVESILETIGEPSKRANIVVLDACRNNPFVRSRGGGSGLAQVSAPAGTLVAYATAPGMTASDGDGRNGLYTGEILKALEEPGLRVEDVFKRVRVNVSRVTSNSQVPWEASSLVGDFVFNGAPTGNAAGKSPAAANPPPRAPASPEERAQEAWRAVASSTTPGPFEAFLKEFPESSYAGVARAKIAELTDPKRQAALAPPPASRGGAVEPTSGTFAATRVASIRAEPNPSARSLAALAPDAMVEVTGRLGEDWVRVAWNGGVGWVQAIYLQEVDRSQALLSGKGRPAPQGGQVGVAVAAQGVTPANVQAPASVPASASVQATAAPAKDTGPIAAPKPAAGERVAVVTGGARPVPGPGTKPAAADVGSDCPGCPQMVSLGAGRFSMGASDEESRRENAPETARREAQPVHAVAVRPFALGKFPVTRGEFAAFAAEAGYDAEGSCWVTRNGKWEQRPNASWREPGFPQTDRDPVVCVSWDDAGAYVAWLARKTGRAYRLPSEAEWEYGARAGTGSARYWGEAAGGGNANCDGCGSQWDNRGTSPVGSFAPNPAGLHDMLGNAWQWTDDCWSASYAGAPEEGEARAAGDCARRVVRGGAWNGDAASARAAQRNRLSTDRRSFNVGFRVARGD